MHSIVIGKKHYPCPSNWQELTPGQALKTAALVFGAASDSPAIRAKVFHLLVPAPAKLLARLTEGQWYDLLSLIDWLWQLPLDTCPLPSFEFEGTTYHLPAPSLDHATMLEYALCDSYFRNFIKNSKDTASLDHLVAVLARPAGANDLGGLRARLDQHVTDRVAGGFARLPISVKILVLQYWVSLMRFITTRYSALFTKPEGESESKGAKPAFDIGWFGVMYDLAENGVFGDFEKVSATGLHTILLFLTKKHFDNKQRKQENGN